jgi:ribosome-binding factor A
LVFASRGVSRHGHGGGIISIAYGRSFDDCCGRYEHAADIEVRGSLAWAGRGDDMKRERLGRIDHEIQRALSKIISLDVKDPRMGFATVTRCEVTQDLMFCKVFVSIIGDRHVARQTMDALKSAAGFIRGELGAAVALRHTPELTFVEDRTTERAIALSKTLEKAQVIDE